MFTLYDYKSGRKLGEFTTFGAARENLRAVGEVRLVDFQTHKDEHIWRYEYGDKSNCPGLIVEIHEEK